jgi:hypothetical protein
MPDCKIRTKELKMSLKLFWKLQHYIQGACNTFVSLNCRVCVAVFFLQTKWWAGAFNGWCKWTSLSNPTIKYACTPSASEMMMTSLQLVLSPVLFLLQYNEHLIDRTSPIVGFELTRWHLALRNNQAWWYRWVVWCCIFLVLCCVIICYPVVAHKLHACT